MPNETETTMTPATGGCWPTADQVLLLRAGLFEREAALEAWTRWRATNNLDTADRGSIRLFPLVYRNLGPDAFGEQDRSLLKGAYRATWFRNQVIIGRAAAAVRELHEAGIRTMLLKGVALAVSHYHDPGIRPMDDIDVLVPAHDHTRALGVLERAGWSPGPEPDGPSPHATSLHGGDGLSIDLHRFALAPPAADEGFWSASVEIELLGVPTRTLCAADQLLHVILHGARWNRIPPVRWLADAAMIERSSGPELDWERVVAEAIRRRGTITLEAALEHLVEAVAFDVPAWALALLRTAPRGPLERWVHRAATGPVGGGGWARSCSTST